MNLFSPILARQEVASFCQSLRHQKRKIVFTNGCFDILHFGHVWYLSEARKRGDFLFVGLNSDSSVRGLKGEERPVQKEQDRATILSSLKSVDAISIFSEATPLELIKAVKPDILVKGGDWDLNKIVGKDFVESCGGRVETIPFKEGHSSSRLIEILKTL